MALSEIAEMSVEDSSSANNSIISIHIIMEEEQLRIEEEVKIEIIEPKEEEKKIQAPANNIKLLLTE